MTDDDATRQQLIDSFTPPDHDTDRAGFLKWYEAVDARALVRELLLGAASRYVAEPRSRINIEWGIVAMVPPYENDPQVMLERAVQLLAELARQVADRHDTAGPQSVLGYLRTQP